MDQDGDTEWPAGRPQLKPQIAWVEAYLAYHADDGAAPETRPGAPHRT